jgi:hypothetical protein
MLITFAVHVEADLPKARRISPVDRVATGISVGVEIGVYRVG